MSNPTSSKTKRKKSETRPEQALDQSDFVAKHRIAGAAFLLFFGALFLPWVLGAPGDNKVKAGKLTQAEDQSIEIDRGDAITGNSNDDLALALASEKITVPEHVYVSKITPLDGSRTNTTPKVKSAPIAEPSKDAESTAVKRAVEMNRVNPVERKTPAAVAGVKNAGAPDPVAEADKISNQSAVSAKPKSEPVNQSIEVGWVVQVGVFIDEKGAGRVVTDLRDKGFDPSTTVVDTNRGKATGTRIWLGPYAQRVEAAKAKSELTKKTGEAGFIRAFP